ncbi:MAG: UDP-N-acetylmuramate dehydrogenase [Bacteroidota bacterium]|jgi:UDP-N-acetylmuramate dehydrogenase
MLQINQNISLQKLNTFGIDVSSKYFVEVGSVNEIIALTNDAIFQQNEQLILGGGSNILFTKNFNGVVIKNNVKGIEVVEETNEHILVKAAAGEVWHQFVLFCIQNNYAGVENLSLIPGCVGASPMQNIGAYGVEIKDVFYSLEAYHLQEKMLVNFDVKDCEFGYRESVFKRKFKNQFIITSVTFKLNKNPDFKISYGAIEQQLKAMKVKELSIKAISDAVISIRSSKLPNPIEIGNAGSFFKNPEISSAKYNVLKAKFENIVAYDVANGNKKLAAGWLIEQCGWKGKTIGNCGVHKNQALVLVNFGAAKGEEIFNLSTEIIQSVNEKFDIELEREVNII